MSKFGRLAKSGWLIAAVVALGALMILPAGSVISGRSVSAPTGASASDLQLSASPAASAVPGAASEANGPTGTAAQSTPETQLLSHVPSSLSHVPWVESLTHQGPTLAPLTSLPNLALLEHPATAVDGQINPFYVAQPAPLGLADYGLGAQTYSYNTSHILGEVTFNTPPNVTDPASTGVTEVSGQSDGYVGSLNEFGIQLNTVATNISIPGSDQGFFWTQNVVNFNDTGIHFVSDTFNMTSATQNPYYIAAGTLYEACDYGQSGISKVLFNYGGVFQCVGGTVPVSPASYPVTVQLYNNASINAQKRSVVTYGYRIIEAGTGQVFTGISDAVIFNSPKLPDHEAANPPGFSIDGFAPSPTGLFRDAEIVLVGNIGGDNSVFRSINGTIHLEYSNATRGGFRSVPSAYNFGGDTGETSTGIADYWTTGHALVINQGPAMLYGLWGAEPYVSVRSGAIHLAGKISPNYGFVFVSNTPAVLDPWNPSLNERDNMSWLPTTDTGTFSTYLPPLGSPWTTAYYVQAFAAGFQELNGSVIHGSDTSYDLSLTSAPGTLNAPLYAFSNAQMALLAKNVVGASGPPYEFNGLVDNMNFTFEHVNDYGYATFEVFMTQGVTAPIWVIDTYQGYDSGGYNNYIFADYGSTVEGGLLAPAPAIYDDPFWTSDINLFDGAHDLVADQVIAGDIYNTQVVLWHDTDATVEDVDAELYTSGVWVGDSVGTQVSNVESIIDSDGVTDMGSFSTTVTDVYANASTGVEALSSTDGSYSWLFATNGAIAFTAGIDYGAEADYDSYYYLPGTTGAVVDNVIAADDSLGVNFSLSHSSTVIGVTALEDSAGVQLDVSHGATVAGVTAQYDSEAVYLHAVKNVHVEQVSAIGDSYGVVVWVSDHVIVRYVLADDYSVGVYVYDSTNVAISHVKAYDHSVGVIIVP